MTWFEVSDDLYEVFDTKYLEIGSMIRFLNKSENSNFTKLTFSESESNEGDVTMNSKVIYQALCSLI